MKFKKISSIILGMAIIVSFTACGNSKTSTGTKVTAAKKITIFQSKVEISDNLQALAKEYTKETGVAVDVWGTTGDSYFQDLKTKMTGGKGPTVYSLAPGAEVDEMASYESDLSDLSFVNDIMPKTEVKNSAGTLVGIPYTVEGFGMVYNKNLLNPSTLTDYNSFVNMLKDQKAKGLDGFGLSQESYFLIGHILNTPFAMQKDPQDFMNKLAKGQVKMADTKEFQDFAKYYAAIRDNTTNPLQITYDQATGNFATGKTASLQQGNWCYSQFADYKSKINFDMALAPFPLDGNDKVAVGVPASWEVNSQATPSEIKAGKDFLNWLYTSTTGKDYLMNKFDFIPVVKGMVNKNLDPLSKSVAEYTATGKTLIWATNSWPAGIVDAYLLPVAQQFFTTKETPEQFLKALDDAWAQACAK